jgi:hypothetical protein
MQGRAQPEQRQSHIFSGPTRPGLRASAAGPDQREQRHSNSISPAQTCSAANMLQERAQSQAAPLDLFSGPDLARLRRQFRRPIQRKQRPQNSISQARRRALRNNMQGRACALSSAALLIFWTDPGLREFPA